MPIITHNDEQLRPRSAILLYSGKADATSDRHEHVATFNNVRPCGEIETPGKYLTRALLDNAINGISDAKRHSSLMDVSRYILKRSDDGTKQVWYTPKLTRRYTTSEGWHERRPSLANLASSSSHMHEWPTMLFYLQRHPMAGESAGYGARSLHVFAIKARGQPSDSTLLYHPSVPQVDAKGQVHSCNLNIPSKILTTNEYLSDVEDSFFFSKFSGMPQPVVHRLGTMREVLA